jgi:para-aminobenzoate synthetase component 1
LSERQWWVRSQPLGHRTGSDIFQHLYGDLLHQPPAPATLVALLESPYPLPIAAQPHAIHSRYSICAGPPRHLDGVAQVWTPAIGHILPTLAERLATADQIHLLGDEAKAAEQTLPFTGGWLGWLGYDLAWEIERLPTLNTDPLPFPVALWYEPATFAVLDHQAQKLWLAAPTPTAIEAMQQRLERPSAEALEQTVTGQGSQAITLAMAAAEYQQAVLQAKRHIQAGDVFQVNLSLRFSTTTTTHSWALYRKLQHINPVTLCLLLAHPLGQRDQLLARTAGEVAEWHRPNSPHCGYSAPGRNASRRCGPGPDPAEQPQGAGRAHYAGRSGTQRSGAGVPVGHGASR